MLTQESPQLLALCIPPDLTASLKVKPGADVQTSFGWPACQMEHSHASTMHGCFLMGQINAMAAVGDICV